MADRGRAAAAWERLIVFASSWSFSSSSRRRRGRRRRRARGSEAGAGAGPAIDEPQPRQATRRPRPGKGGATAHLMAAMVIPPAGCGWPEVAIALAPHAAAAAFRRGSEAGAHPGPLALSLVRSSWLPGLLAVVVPGCVAQHTSVLGRSVQRRPIVAVEVAAPHPRAAVLVVGCIHGNEPAGIAVATRLRRARPVAGIDLWVIDDLNPDGVAAGTRQNAHGVDLNRNFPWRWQPAGRPGDQQYPGPDRCRSPRRGWRTRSSCACARG